MKSNYKSNSLETNIFGVVKLVITGVNYNRDVLRSTFPYIVFVINGISFKPSMMHITFHVY